MSQSTDMGGPSLGVNTPGQRLHVVTQMKAYNMIKQAKSKCVNFSGNEFRIQLKFSQNFYVILT